MGNENSASKKNVKPIIIAVVAVLVIVAAFFIVSSFVDTGSLSHEALTPGEVQGLDAQQGEIAKDKKTESGTTTTKASDMADSDIVDKNAGYSDYVIVDEITTTKADPNKNLKENAASKIIDGAKALRRWEASNVISKVVVEKLAVSLPVYEDGVKTTQSKSRNVYIAEINTRPSRISVVAASQFTNNKVADIRSFVKGFENEMNQDILFASNNEMCARNYDNPMENIFYNGDDSLTATVIKNGVIAQRGSASKDSLVMYKDGTWKYPVNVSMSSAEELIKSGAIASVSYTYPVIWEGEKYNHPECGVDTGIWLNHSLDPETNYSLIGKTGNDKYYVIVGEGCGMGYLAEIMLNGLGVEYAYWGNGGAAAAMYVKGYGIVTPHDYVVHGDFFCVR
ncbi:MAG: hypothetical protein IJZ57_10540 [Clostridia bacterium]|nr:hypothetical protein [Clostridia bacterium]